MLIIYAEKSNTLLYTLKTVFSNWLGLEWTFFEVDSKEIKIVLEHNSGELVFPNLLFRQLSDVGLNTQILPNSTIPKIKSFSFLAHNQIEEDLPILYFNQPLENKNQVGVEEVMQIDFLGGIFFMISRIEEVISEKRDDHDRFLSSDSISVKNSFVDRPIVDEYVEVLWGILKTQWQTLERVQLHGSVVPTCDVDRPLEFPNNPMVIGKQFVKELISSKNKMSAIQNGVRRSYALLGNYDKDSNLNNMRWMMSENEKNNRLVEFNFVAGITDKKRDPFYKLSDSPIKAILKEIDTRGHKIGIHPSYNTYLSDENMESEVNCLRETMRSIGINQELEFGRQHFLRWKTPDTLHNWINSGLKYDSTMGYADVAGFRSGTAKQYQWFDVQLDTETSLIERPLIFMECSVLAERYMNMDYSKSTLDYILKLKERSVKYGGDFVFLWHDYYFYSEKDFEFYSIITK